MNLFRHVKFRGIVDDDLKKMVKNAITVFARIKPEKSRRKVMSYEIHRRPKKHLNEDFLVINGPPKFTEYIDNRPDSWNFSFHRIFAHAVPQVDVFDSVARPIIDSVIDGYNATIFAYGQTGSGKTYTISGEQGIHEERGILPRTLEYIFDVVKKNSENMYVIEVAYLEIYNENGYDLLLDHKERETATRLEDLPRVTIQEDESGTMHLKNLSFRIVENESEALQFLLDGDSYRAISETPMNPRSSRSHCIFTIVVSVKKYGSDRYCRAKMHLVDLAGSERVYKCAIQGTILTEAKHINLSLHFLEQVIVSLGQDNVSHVPYRNSLLTSVLRDSLGGNCLTTMLATLSVSHFNLEETISTCRFAQRVALVKNDVNLTFEIDTKSENALLRQEIERLKRQIQDMTKQNAAPEVTRSIEYYKSLVVQRDQEISHLIDLLEKERSLRKSVVKEIPMAVKELPQQDKYTQFPSSRSPTKSEHVCSTNNKLQVKQKRGSFPRRMIATSPRKNESQSTDITEKRTSSERSTESQDPAIHMPVLKLIQKNDLDVRHTAHMLGESQKEDVVFRSEVDEVKKSAVDHETSRTVLTERDTETADKRKLNVMGLGDIESKKDEYLAGYPAYEGMPKIDTNSTTGSVNRTNDKKTEISVPSKNKIQKDTQMAITELPRLENAEINRPRERQRTENFPEKNTSREKALGLEFPHSIMKMLRTSCNQPTDDRNDSTRTISKHCETPSSGFKTPNIRNMTPPQPPPCIEENSVVGSTVDCAGDKIGMSSLAQRRRDAKSDNIVRIPLPLTGDPDIDEEIIAFYKAKETGHSC